MDPNQHFLKNEIMNRMNSTEYIRVQFVEYGLAKLLIVYSCVYSLILDIDVKCITYKGPKI